MGISPDTFAGQETYDQALRRASELWGIQQDYWDIFGKQHFCPPDVQHAILRSLGVPVETQETLSAAISDRLWHEWACLVPATYVGALSQGWIPVQVPSDQEGASAEAVFEWEDGTTTRVEAELSQLSTDRHATVRGTSFIRKRLPLPESARLGYHRVCVRTGSLSQQGRLILCPDHAFKPDFIQGGGKAGGIAISLYGLRSHRNWGCGDFTDLRTFTDWVADELGAAFIALNPLHSIPNRQPYNTSPYLPNCSFYRNALYIDVEAIEDFARCPAAQRLLASPRVQQQIAELRTSEYVEYERVWALKQRFLKLAFRQFRRDHPDDTPRAQEFRRYIDTEGDLLHRYATYLALDEVIHKQDRNIWIWPDWPADFRDVESPAVAEFARKYWRLVLFYKYVQWQLERQLEAAQQYTKQRGLAIGLYHDLALATDRCGSDLWAYGPFYVAGCRVGSPPDAFSPAGQDWAFPPPNSDMHHRDGYQLFVASIRQNCKHGGALRIDHVMRFFRLFWIPDGKEALEGIYVKDYSDDLLRILSLESVRNQVIVIGEDLGTVEPYIREALHQYGILSYRLLFFERRKDGAFKKPQEYPRQSLVSVSTHDLPTLAGFWTGRDIEARRTAGTIGDAAYQEQFADRAKDKQRLLDVMFELGLLPEWFPRNAADVPEFTGELHHAAVGFLATTPSELMVLNQEDLFKETEQQNLPGTTWQYPNWRRKIRYQLEELRSNEVAAGCTHMFRHWLERTNRIV
jgi:4-alpha-glucanotransferase